MKSFDSCKEELVSEVIKDYSYKYATVNKLYNCYQYYKHLLILDLRDANTFFKAHFFCSVNIPDSSILPNELLKYNPIEFAHHHFTKCGDKTLFEQRKRLMVFIVPSNSSLVKFTEDPSLLIKELSNVQKNKDRILKARRFALSCLLYQALKKEKIRELYVLKEGFRNVLKRIPFLCQFQDSRIYPEP
jgi:hypothetical protein